MQVVKRMAELLGALLGIAGLLDLALDLAETSNRHVGQAHNANGMIRDDLLEIADLGGVFHNLKEVVERAQASVTLRPESALRSWK